MKQVTTCTNCTQAPPFLIRAKVTLFYRFYGGWVAPNIYYLGCSGVVRYKGITIAGMSGIYKRYDYRQGFHERLPFTEDTKRSIYHIREYDVQKLSRITSPTIMMSHDWPTNIHRYGNHKSLLAKKPHFREDIQKGELGSPPAETLLHSLRPKYWFSAHLHVKFAAFVDHRAPPPEDPDEEGEILLSDSDDDPEDKLERKRAISSTEDSDAKRPRQEQSLIGNTTTKFLALDKCLPRREFLQILDIEMDEDVPSTDALSHDPQWLAITKTFHPYLSTTRKQNALPGEEELER